MEKWNEICFIIHKHKEKNSPEDFFQNEIENVFEKLGWSRYKNEILSKQTIRVGATNNVKPDIILSMEKENIIVVELKKPNQISLSKYIEQLTSYMRLLRLNYGIYIGDNIQMYYDDPNDRESPIKIFETSFTMDNVDGVKFIELISKENFNEIKLQEFCDEKLEELTDRKIADNLIERLKSVESIAKFRDFLRDDLSKDYNENIVNIVIDSLSITINNHQSKESKTEKRNVPVDSITSHYNASDKLPIEIIPNVEEFKKEFIETGSAVLCYYYEDGHIEEKPWENRNFTESANVKGNLRSRPEARRGKWKTMGIVKLVCKIKT